jgi:hypothetical protein
MFLESLAKPKNKRTKKEGKNVTIPSKTSHSPEIILAQYDVAGSC